MFTLKGPEKLRFPRAQPRRDSRLNVEVGLSPMSAKISLSKQRSQIVHLRFDNTGDFKYTQDVIPSSRATRLISDPERFLKVSFSTKLKDSLVRQLLVDKIKNGISFGGKK